MRDFLLGLAFAIAGVAIVAVARTYPTMPTLQFGPGLFPSMIGVGMFVGGTLLACRRVKVLRAAKASPIAALKHYDYRALLMSLVPCALIVFYILAADRLGAALCMAISMAALMLMRGARLWVAIVVSGAVAGMIFWLFSRYLLIPLPSGTLLASTPLAG